MAKKATTKTGGINLATKEAAKAAATKRAAKKAVKAAARSEYEAELVRLQKQAGRLSHFVETDSFKVRDRLLKVGKAIKGRHRSVQPSIDLLIGDKFGRNNAAKACINGEHDMAQTMLENAAAALHRYGLLGVEIPFLVERLGRTVEDAVDQLAAELDGGTTDERVEAIRKLVETSNPHPGQVINTLTDDQKRACKVRVIEQRVETRTVEEVLDRCHREQVDIEERRTQLAEVNVKIAACRKAIAKERLAAVRSSERFVPCSITLYGDGALAKLTGFEHSIVGECTVKVVRKAAKEARKVA